MQTTARFRCQDGKVRDNTSLTQHYMKHKARDDDNWPISRQNREVTKKKWVKTHSSKQSRTATGRESILCKNCAHVECDINEYKRKIKTNTGNSSGRFSLFSRLQLELILKKKKILQSSDPEHNNMTLNKPETSEIYKLINLLLVYWLV